MAVNIGPKIGIDGEAQFRKELNNIIQQSKTLASEIKAVTSAFDKNDNSQEKLAAQSAVLTKQIELQQQKVEMLQKKLDKAKKEFGETDTETLKWQKSVYEATAALNKMERQLSDVENGVDNTADSLDDAADSALSFGDVLKANVLSDAIMSGLNAIADAARDAGRAFVEFAKEGVQTASDLEEVQNVVDVTFGESTDKVDAFAKSAAAAYGLSELSAKKYTGTMGAMLKSMGFSESAVLDMSTQMTALAGDFASFYNLDHEEAFNKIRSGISGETEPLKQLGINMSVANLEAYALAQGIETAYKDMTEAEKATLRYNYLMEAGADAQGDFARTSNSFANQQRILELELENVGSEIGKRLIPYIQDLITAARKFLKTADFDEMFDTVEGIISFVLKNSRAIITTLKTIGASVAAIGIVSGAQKAITAMKALAMSFNPVTTGIGLVAGAFTWASSVMKQYIKDGLQTIEVDAERIQRSDELRESYEQLTIAANERANAGLAEIENTKLLYAELQGLADINGTVAENDKARAQFILGELNQALGTEYTMTGNVIDQYATLASEIQNVIQTKQAEILLSAYEDQYREAIEKRMEAMQNASASLYELQQQEKIVEEARTAAAETGVEQYAFVAGEWISLNQQQVLAAQARVEEEEKALAEIQAQYAADQELQNQYFSTIQTYQEAQTLAMQGNTEGVIDLLSRQGTAFQTAKDLSGESAEQQREELKKQYDIALINLERYAEEMEKGTEGYTSDMLATLAQYALDAANEAEKAGNDISNVTMEKLSALASDAYTWGEDMVTGFSNGIESKRGEIIRKADGIANEIKKRLHFSRPDVGPLRDYETWMPDMVQGMAEGIRANAYKLENAVASMAGGMSANVNGKAGASNMGGVYITVNGAPGQDENRLADIIMLKIQNATARREAVW